MTDINVLALVGSLRAASVNRQIAQVASENGPDGISVAVYDGLGDIPFYNEDIDGADAPAAAQNLRAAVADADAVLVITPEYNPASANNSNAMRSATSSSATRSSRVTSFSPTVRLAANASSPILSTMPSARETPESGSIS